VPQNLPLKIRQAILLLPSATVRLSLLVTILFGAVLISVCSNRTELDNSVKNLTFKTLTGTEIALRSINQPVLINFWATSCTICIAEMPDLVALYEEYSGYGFELIAIAMPYDPPNQVLELVQRQELPFPVALDLEGEAVAAFASVKGTPTSFLLDSKGKLVRRYVGAIDLQKLRRELDQLLEIS
jgi:thiol-disulfide isomerase/thioredoxin